MEKRCAYEGCTTIVTGRRELCTPHLKKNLDARNRRKLEKQKISDKKRPPVSKCKACGNECKTKSGYCARCDAPKYSSVEVIAQVATARSLLSENDSVGVMVVPTFRPYLPGETKAIEIVKRDAKRL